MLKKGESSRSGYSSILDSKKMENRDRGVAALEFALLLPLLLSIIIGIIEWGWVFFLDLTLTNAVREGARVGVTREYDSGDPENDENAINAAKSTVGTYLSKAWGGLEAESISATFENSDNDLRVTAMIQVTSLFNFLPSDYFYVVFPQHLTATAVMRWELAGVSSP